MSGNPNTNNTIFLNKAVYFLSTEYTIFNNFEYTICLECLANNYDANIHISGITSRIQRFGLTQMLLKAKNSNVTLSSRSLQFLSLHLLAMVIKQDNYNAISALIQTVL